MNKIICYRPIGRHPALHGIRRRISRSRPGGRTQYPRDGRNGLFFLRAQAAAVAFSVQPSADDGFGRFRASRCQRAG